MSDNQHAEFPKAELVHKPRFWWIRYRFPWKRLKKAKSEIFTIVGIVGIWTAFVLNCDPSPRKRHANPQEICREHEMRGPYEMCVAHFISAPPSAPVLPAPSRTGWSCVCVMSVNMEAP